METNKSGNGILKKILCFVAVVVLLGVGVFAGYMLRGDKDSLQGNSLNDANNSTGYSASDANASDANASSANATSTNAQ